MGRDGAWRGAGCHETPAPGQITKPGPCRSARLRSCPNSELAVSLSFESFWQAPIVLASPTPCLEGMHSAPVATLGCTPWIARFERYTGPLRSGRSDLRAFRQLPPIHLGPSKLVLACWPGSGLSIGGLLKLVESESNLQLTTLLFKARRFTPVPTRFVTLDARRGSDHC